MTLPDELRAAAGREPGDQPGAFVAILARHGVLDRFAEPDDAGGYRYAAPWREVLHLLAGVGGADLGTGRLLEGHLNALQLVALYGTPGQQRSILALVRKGGLLGVWGADAAPPARLEPAGVERWALRGAKRYASGAGTLAAAVVPISHEDGTMQLVLLRVDDPSRVDLGTWDQRGMRRTASGTFDLNGLVVGPEALLGAVDDYKREPFFVGGIWRCAAAQLGAIEAITAAIATELAGNGRDNHPLQMARIGTAILAARTARLWVEDAACRVETAAPDADAAAIARIVSLSAYARLACEKAAMEVIDLAERALGLGSFAASHPVEALTRDLAVYIRQANPDAVLLGHGRVLARDFVR